MASGEMYRPVPSIRITASSLEELHGEPIVANCIFADKEIPEFALVTVSPDKKAFPVTTTQTSPVSLVQISTFHGRSYEAKFPEYPPFAWEDEFGNLFASFSSKGNNFTDPKIFSQDVSPSGYAIKGAQDTDAILRVLKAS